MSSLAKDATVRLSPQGRERVFCDPRRWERPGLVASLKLQTVAPGGPYVSHARVVWAGRKTAELLPVEFLEVLP